MRKFGAQRAFRVFKKGVDLPFGEGANAYLGTKPSIEHRDAPIAAAQCVEQLNSFAPLQWSNTLEVCNVTRYCKKRPREPDTQVDPMTVLLAEQLASLEALYPSILQPTLSLTEGFVTVVHDKDSGISSTLGSNDGTTTKTTTTTATTTLETTVELTDTELSRQNRISANLIANVELGIRSLSEVGASSRLQSFPQALVCSQHVPKVDYPKKLALTVPDQRKGPDCVSRPCVFIRQSISFYNPDGSEITAAGSGGCSCRYRSGVKELQDLLPSVSHVTADELKKSESSRFSIFGTSAVPSAPSLPAEEDLGPLPMSQQLSQSGQSREVTTVKKLRTFGTLKSRAWTLQDMHQGLPIKFTSAEAFRMAVLNFDLSTLSTARPIAESVIEKAQEWEDAVKEIFQ